MKDRRENGSLGRESGKRKRDALLKREKAAVQRCGAACGRAETLRERRGKCDPLHRTDAKMSSSRRRSEGGRTAELARRSARLRQIAEH